MFDLHIANDHELPEGVDRVMVETEDGAPVLIVRRSLAQTCLFVRAWQDSLPPEQPRMLRAV